MICLSLIIVNISERRILIRVPFLNAEADKVIQKWSLFVVTDHISLLSTFQGACLRGIRWRFSLCYVLIRCHSFDLSQDRGILTMQVMNLVLIKMKYLFLQLWKMLKKGRIILHSIPLYA